MARELNILTIAGLDPSGGAGMLADFSVFQEEGLRAHAVCTALTAQNDTQCLWVKALGIEEILLQLKPLLDAYEFSAFKIGMINNAMHLNSLLTVIKMYQPEVPIVWDPVLKSTAGTTLTEDFSKEELEFCLAHIDVLTPNIIESEKFLSILGLSTWEAAKYAVVLKGGHDTDDLSTDILFQNGDQYPFSEKRLDAGIKGSGCRFASYLASRIAKGDALQEAVPYAKQRLYTLLQTED